MADKTILIDTSLFIDYFRKTDKTKTRLVQLSLQGEKFAISSITEYEIYCGATSAQIQFWQDLLAQITVLPFDSLAALIAVDIEQKLKKIRRSIDKADLFIAATAIANNLPFDTLNRKHFDKIERLILL